MSWQHFFDLHHREMASGVVGLPPTRLVLAAILGGIIGLSVAPLGRAERE
ncbi:MAG: hypothetical protein ABSE44_16335 [Candidatus Sulfotelmatobacter sp.]|jgi:hypothetical protein